MIAQAAEAGRSEIFVALRQAAARTGTDFDYLLRTATRESGLKTNAKSNTSSATGLFQFVDQTWLGLVKRYGAAYGLGAYADAIEERPGGGYSVPSAELKGEILALRKDPAVASYMAGEHVCETKGSLEAWLGREVGCGELYAAHFLGEAGARKLIALNAENPDQAAADAFGRAASANRNVFYHRDGTPKTVGELYAWAKGQADTPLPAVAPAPVASDVPAANRASLFRASDYGVDMRSSYSTLAGSALPRPPFAITADVVAILSLLEPASSEAASDKNA